MTKETESKKLQNDLCCFDNIYWRKSKDNHSDPIPDEKDPEMAPRNHFDIPHQYYPYYENQGWLMKDGTVSGWDEKNGNKKVYCPEGGEKKRPGYSKLYAALDGIDDVCHPKHRYIKSKTPSHIFDERNKLSEEGARVKNAKPGFIIPPKSTRTISEMEMNCCLKDPDNQRNIQVDEFKDSLKDVDYRPPIFRDRNPGTGAPFGFVCEGSDCGKGIGPDIRQRERKATEAPEALASMMRFWP